MARGAVETSTLGAPVVRLGLQSLDLLDHFRAPAFSVEARLPSCSELSGGQGDVERNLLWAPSDVTLNARSLQMLLPPSPAIDGRVRGARRAATASKRHLRRCAPTLLIREGPSHCCRSANERPGCQPVDDDGDEKDGEFGTKVPSASLVSLAAADIARVARSSSGQTPIFLLGILKDIFKSRDGYANRVRRDCRRQAGSTPAHHMRARVAQPLSPQNAERTPSA